MKYALVMVALAACGGGNAETPTQIEFGGDRVAYLEVPTTYDHSVPTPLLVVLHVWAGRARTALAKVFSRLPPRLDGAVEAALAKVASADDRIDVA